MSNLTTRFSRHLVLKNIIPLARNCQLFDMIGQSKISTFFSSKNNKRSSDTASDQSTPPKKSKSSDEQENVTTETLSQEQKQKMEANKLNVITKILALKTKEIEGTTPPKKQASKSSETLSPEQKQKMEANKLNTITKILALKTKEIEGATPPKKQANNSSETLSPEQKQKMEANKQKAIAKLHALKSSGIAVSVGESWHTALQSEFTKPYFVELSRFVEKERSSYTVYPPPNQVFTWTQMSDINQVKVVILGQDPYHGPGQAHGLCFSVQKGIKPPPSLANMYKELTSDIEGFKHPGHGTLNGWAEQGVLLLNACLTVRAHNANSHAGKGWEKFTDAVISWFNKHKNGIVFMLWGSYAQKKGACIDKKRHHILKAVHPSPLSAHRGFFGCKHFSKCNSLLKEQGKKPIDWTNLPPE